MANLLWVGIVLGTFASMSGTIGKQMLRYSELQKRAGAKYRAKVALTTGLLLNTLIGPIVDMASYAFAPQSIIAPLGGLDVVWNTLSAPFTLGESLTPLLIFGVAIIASGAIGTSFFGSHEEKEFSIEIAQEILIRPTVGFYLLALAAWLAFNIFVLIPRSAAPRGEPWITGDPIRGLSLGMTAGSIAGNMFCVKAFVELVQQSIVREDDRTWSHWLPYCLLLGAIFFAVSNLYFLTKAMREYEALFMGAVFEGALILFACISGVVVFSDLAKLTWFQVGLYWLALFGIVGGIFAVAIGVDRKSPAPEPTEGDAAETAQEELTSGSAEVARVQPKPTPLIEDDAVQASNSAELAQRDRGISCGSRNYQSDNPRERGRSISDQSLARRMSKKTRTLSDLESPFRGVPANAELIMGIMTPKSQADIAESLSGEAADGATCIGASTVSAAPDKIQEI